MKTFTAVLLLGTGLLWSQQATPPGAAERRPDPFTAAEVAAIPLVPQHAGKSVKKTLFDGKTLNGWNGSPDYWSVKDGAIVGKSSAGCLPLPVHQGQLHRFPPHRILEDGGIRKPRRRLPVGRSGGGRREQVEHARPAGDVPQAGNVGLHQRHLPARLLQDHEQVTSQHEWIKVEILAQGNRVRSAFNGVEVMEWREPDPNRIKVGPIGLQLHGFNGEQEVLYKDVVLERSRRKTGCSP